MKLSSFILTSEFDKIIGAYLGNSELEKLKFRVNSLPFGKSQNYNQNTINRTKLDLILTFIKRQLKERLYIELLFELGKYYLNHGELQAASDLLHKSLKENSIKISASLKGNIYLKLAEVYTVQADWDDVNEYLKLARKLFNECNDKKGIADVQNFIGTVNAEKGNINSAKKEFEKALANIGNTKANAQKSKLYNNLATIQNQLGEFEKAKELYEKALKYFDDAVDVKSIAEVKHNLGMVGLRMGDLTNAVHYFRESIKLSEKNRIHPILGISYLGLAEVFIAQSKLVEAEKYVEKALTESTKINDRLTIADSYKLNGILLREKGEYDSAEFMFLTSYRMNDELSNELNLAETAVELALLYKKQNKEELVYKYYDEAELYYKKNRCFRDINRMKTLLNIN